MSDSIKKVLAVSPRTEPRQLSLLTPEIPRSCPDCERRQLLMLQLATLADSYRIEAEELRNQAEAYRRMYLDALISAPVEAAA